MNLEQRRNNKDRRKPKNSEEACLSATLSTTDPTWSALGVNPGVRGENPTAIRLSYDTAVSLHTYILLIIIDGEDLKGPVRDSTEGYY